MIKRMLSSEKGSSSVFVLLLLVVMMVFGLAALSIALSNVRLGAKVAGFNATYYAAEGQAWERFAQIDKAVSLASGQTRENIAEAVKTQLDALDFETQMQIDTSTVMISYQTDDNNSGIVIAVTLALDTEDMHSLRAVEWKLRNS